MWTALFSVTFVIAVALQLAALSSRRLRHP